MRRKITKSCALLLIAAPLFAQAAEREVSVTARGLNVRTSEGEILCAVPNGTKLQAYGRHGDGARVRVRINARGCPKDGYVAASFVRPVANGKTQFDSLVDTDALSFRTKPSSDDETFACALPESTRLTVIDRARFADETSWVKVRLAKPRRGCPAEGFVAEAYLRSADTFADLPVQEGTTEDEDVVDCSGPACRKKTDDAADPLKGVSRQLGRRISDVDGNNPPWVNGLKRMVKNRRAKPEGLRVSRGLVQIPLKGNRAPCGAFHYNTSPAIKPNGKPDPTGVKSENRVFASPLAACSLISVMQDWKKSNCPKWDAGCRISLGDISHVTDPKFLHKHATHTNGECIDFRPMSKGEFTGGPLNMYSGSYDRAKTREFVNMLKAKGGTVVLFNDTSIGTRKARGHANHIHVCFKDNKLTRSTCDKLKVDEKVCPEL